VTLQTQRSLIADKQTGATMDETDIPMVDLNRSSTDIYNNNKNMKTPSIEELNNDFHRSHFSRSPIKKHSVDSINRVATTSGFPFVDPKQVISKSLLDN